MNKKIGAATLFTNGEKVLLILRSDGKGWGFPGGKKEPGETSLQNAERECQEEIGINEVPGKIFSEIENDLFVIYFRDCEPFECNLNKEHTKWNWFDLDSLPNNMHHKIKNEFIKFKKVIKNHFSEKIKEASMKFADFYKIQENSDTLDQPHIISADPEIKLPKSLTKLVEAFKESKNVPLTKEVDPKTGGDKFITLRTKKLYLVGGAVRDYLLKRTPANYNLVTDAHTEEVEKICKFAKIKVVDSAEKKGIVKVEINGDEYTIETMRGENGFTTDMAIDSKRRDLTINAIYYDLVSDKIYDYVGGIQDLKSGKIKLLGKPAEKLKKEPNLVSRYARIKNLIPDAHSDDDTEELIANNSNNEFDKTYSRDEFWKGLTNLHSDPHSYVKSWNKYNLLPKIFNDVNVSDEIPDVPTNKSKAIVLASILKKNDPHELFAKKDSLGMSDREARDVVFLINLSKMNPTNIDEFKNRLLRTGLTFRQIKDWANSAKIDSVDKLF